eukprot:TRINITY_DN5387_c0_g1_i1.p2 TRINITY_DN5387_c0_g1~~TRINITY_DN5387_c0_g1_i1.p2  ORF type:complete len:107 (-),score=8.20 TRINITY_DN5387_c0_g1_i1:81-401(-)
MEASLNYWRITVYHSHPNQSYNYSTFAIVDSNGHLMLDFFYPKQCNEHHYYYQSGTPKEVGVHLWSGNVLTVPLRDHHVIHLLDSKYQNWDIRVVVDKCDYQVVRL